MIIAVVATYDEPNVGWLVRTLIKTYVDKVVVVDDSPTSETANAAIDAGALVVRGPGKGLGRAQRLGWKNAIGLGAQYIVQIDAGGSHDPVHLAKMLYEDADVVIGSRFVSGGSYRGRLWRDMASRVYAGYMNLRVDYTLHDWTSGYRVFTVYAALELLQSEYKCRQHGWQAECLLRAQEAGMKIREVPISYTAGQSSLRLRHVWEALRVT